MRQSACIPAGRTLERPGGQEPAGQLRSCFFPVAANVRTPCHMQPAAPWLMCAPVLPWCQLEPVCMMPTQERPATSAAPCQPLQFPGQTISNPLAVAKGAPRGLHPGQARQGQARAAAVAIPMRMRSAVLRRAAWPGRCLPACCPPPGKAPVAYGPGSFPDSFPTVQTPC